MEPDKKINLVKILEKEFDILQCRIKPENQEGNKIYSFFRELYVEVLLGKYRNYAKN